MSGLYGTLASRVRIVFVDFHTEMWRFGGMSNAVMHNEVASGQHEILPIFALMTCLGKLERPDARALRIFLETLPSIFLALRLVRLIHWTRRITWTASTLIVERRIVALITTRLKLSMPSGLSAPRLVISQAKGVYRSSRCLVFVLTTMGFCVPVHWACPNKVCCCLMRLDTHK